MPREIKGSHTARHAMGALTEVDAETVQIQFGPEVMKGLKRLEHAVHGKKDFDSDTRFLLKKLTSGKPINLGDAFTNLMMVASDALEFAHSTGNMEAKFAVDEIAGHLMGRSIEAKPIMVLLDSPQRMR